MTWLLAHWLQIATVLGIYAAIATLINRLVWPKPPAPKWAVILHALLVDGPAFLPSADFRGIFGLPFNVPYLTLSGAPRASDAPAPPAPPLGLVK